MAIWIDEDYKKQEMEKTTNLIKKEITLSLNQTELDEINQALINWANTCQTNSLRTKNQIRQQTQKEKAQRALELAVTIHKTTQQPTQETNSL